MCGLLYFNNTSIKLFFKKCFGKVSKMDCQGSYGYGVNIIIVVELTSWKKRKKCFHTGCSLVPFRQILLNYINTEPLAKRCQAI